MGIATDNRIISRHYEMFHMKLVCEGDNLFFNEHDTIEDFKNLIAITFYPGLLMY